MLHGVSIPLVAKLCAVAVVTTGAGVVTYEIVTGPGADPAEVITEESPIPVLTYADDSDEQLDEVDDVKAAKPEKKSLSKPRPEAVTEQEGVDEREESGVDQEKPEEPADTVPPELVILHPADGSHHDEKFVVFEGETEPGAVVKAGPYAATVDSDGRWRIELILNPGANRAVLSAFDPAGNETEAAVTVHLDVEEVVDEVEDKEKPADEDEPKVVEFAANQKWGTCEEEVPYDIFWGTATPQTVVHIVSAHGSAEVEVGPHGHWEKKVYFESAPRGEAFLVVVEAVNGRAEFQFVATESTTTDAELEK